MHEFSLMADLLRKIDSLAREQQAKRVSSVKVRLGALCHISPDHFRDHFIAASHGTVAEGARLDLALASDPADASSQDIYLESITLEE
jgi:hydrogenase nickel incorporation protein HypA/HybF